MEGILGRYQLSKTTIIVIVGSLVGYWVTSVIKHRRAYRHLNGSLKAPPFSMWFGSIPSIADLYKSSPMESHPHATMTILYRKHNLGNMYILDTWPAAADRVMMVNDPGLAAQVTQQFSLPKSNVYPKMIKHIVGETSLLLTEGEAWKRVRTLFNPGFATSHLMTLVPSIVDDTLIFCEKLNELSVSQEVTPLEDSLARLFIDIMGHIILDHDLNSQTTENPLVDAFRSASDWTPNPQMTHWIFSMNPVSIFFKWLYARRMNAYLAKCIQERLAKKDTEQIQSKTKMGRRPAIDLAVDEYLDQDRDSTNSARPKVDAYFLQVAIDQMKSFLFAGHDTSSSTICFIFYLLHLHPEYSVKVREEHDRVYGPIASTPEMIKEKPHLLNDLPWTTAVIKETLRLFPPASTARQGTDNLSIVDTDGTAYPTENMTVWVNLHTIHRRADLFPKPDEFIPERFLPAPNNSQEITKDSWRPFEKGPRGCIGQELAMLEMKICLAMTCREFVVADAYEEWDRRLGREKPGEMLGGKRGMFGYRMYGAVKVTNKPVDGMPARVSKREK